MKVDNEAPVYIALHAYSPKAFLEHETTLEMGIVVINHATAKPFLLVNSGMAEKLAKGEEGGLYKRLIHSAGAKPTKFRIEVDPALQQSLSVSPAEGVVSPKSQFKIIVRLEAKEGETQVGPISFNGIPSNTKKEERRQKTTA